MAGRHQAVGEAGRRLAGLSGLRWGATSSHSRADGRRRVVVTHAFPMLYPPAGQTRPVSTPRSSVSVVAVRACVNNPFAGCGAAVEPGSRGLHNRDRERERGADTHTEPRATHARAAGPGGPRPRLKNINIPRATSRASEKESATQRTQHELSHTRSISHTYARCRATPRPSVI